MIYTKNLTVDISGKSSLRTIMYSKQGDGRMYALNITITDNGEPYPLNPDEVHIMLSAHKPDGTNILDDDPNTIWINDGDDAGTVGVMLKPSMQAAAGNVLIEIIILDNQNNQITTANIINCVLPRAVREEEIVSSDDYAFLQKLILDAHTTYDDVKDYADAADQSAIDAQGAKTAAQEAQGLSEAARDAAKAWATGTGAISSDEQYENNAKYYAESIIGDAEAAEESANQAKGYKEFIEDYAEAFSVFEIYNPNKQYVEGNKVSYSGSSYFCIKDSLGNAPTNGEYWILIAAKGDAGAAGADGYTPVKGTDYFTDADKSELVAAVLAELPVVESEGY